MKVLSREICDGEVIPTLWAVAYRDFNRETSVVYPIPLHLIVRWARDALFWLMSVGRPGYRERIEAKMWRDGYWKDAEQHGRDIQVLREQAVESREQGQRVGYQEGWAAACKRMDDKLTEYFEARRA